jgi:hypothetical protein
MTTIQVVPTTTAIRRSSDEKATDSAADEFRQEKIRA